MKELTAPAGEVAFTLIEHTILADGRAVDYSLVHSCSREDLLEGFRQLSKESRYQRFHGPVRRLTENQLRLLTDIDTVNRTVVAAHVDDGRDRPRGIGLARYVRYEEEESAAEFAVAVTDPYQGLGIGTRLVAHLRDAARERGIAILRGHVLPSNGAMIRIMEGCGARRSAEPDGTLRFDVETPAADPRGAGR